MISILMRCPRPLAPMWRWPQEIAQAGPFGAGNPEPLLALSDVRVVFADVVGDAHVRLRLAGGDGTGLDAIAFRSVGTPLGDGLLASRGQAHPCGGQAEARRLERACQGQA